MDLTASLAALGLLVGSSGVVLDTHPPYPGALGLACAQSFRAIAGNAQDRCPAGYEGRVLYPAAFRDVYTLLNVLTHEQYHLDHPEEGPAGDPFREREAYRFACAAFPVDDVNVCPTWARKEIQP